jgi:Putative amidoligase enzyme
MSELNWKIGFEIELMAPRGLSRQDLAAALAQQHHGLVRRIFYPQSEPSKVAETPLFHNLTLGFEVIAPQGHLIARCVDDLTLQDDLERTEQPKPGWYRIVSDDTRILQLVSGHADPADPLNQVLKPIANLFFTQQEAGSGGMVRVADNTGNPIAIAAPLPGERERPCELITPPIDTNHLERLEVLLATARSLGFTIPVEGATHLHFDAVPLCSASVFANLVNLLWTHGENLKRLVGTNPRCRRLGMWDRTLWELINEPDFRTLSWFDAASRLAKLQITKYCDFNLKNLIHSIPDKLTFEARIFPTWIHSQPIIAAAVLMEAILRYAISTEISPAAPLEWNLESVQTFLKSLPMHEHFLQIWLSHANNLNSVLD